jgi:uncharacterized membrane protein YcaP (DUF421 family)
MKFINQTLRSEKITTINLAKIIHRVIISIDFRVLHIIIIIAILIIVNITSCLDIAASFFYLINSKEKIVSRINQVDCINQN